ncbi:fibropellin-1-like [Asterias rubens]|uniref:fibropellin-1-like n=1 Tax=Asterias rubens TaxID=7604 RepID=UPI0014550F08|nr:fibropellin-1-like [Asterias rubens]
MSTRPLRKQLSWLLLGILLATTSTSQAQNNPCQQSQQLCLNGAICRPAYLNPGYICECQGSWQGQNCEQRLPGLSPSIPKECGSNFYSDSGVITTTNFPLPPNDNEDCFYIVRIPSAESITFFFDVFLSENHKDGLIIYPGTTVNDQSSDLRTYIGTDQIAPQTFNTNQVVLYWYTDFNVPSGGFSIRYEADPDPCWVNPCQNGGFCNRIGSTGTNGYQCTCLLDFSGVNCEIGTVIVSQTAISVSSGIPVIQGRLTPANKE